MVGIQFLLHIYRIKGLKVNKKNIKNKKALNGAELSYSEIRKWRRVTPFPHKGFCLYG